MEKQTPQEPETEDQAVQRLAETKTVEDLLRIKASLQGSLALAPPGEYYGKLFMGIIRVDKALDLKKKETKTN
jgi:hypothetical protein